MKKNDYIYTSIFDIFKIAPEPSSSHTMSPMKAGNHFKKYVESLKDGSLEKIFKIKIELYGLLSATGRGHGTHRAVAGGVMGMTPQECDLDVLLDLLEREDDKYELSFKNKRVTLQECDICFCSLEKSLNFPYANTLIIKLLDRANNIVIEKEYYPLGGGFIKCKDESEEKRNKQKYLYKNFEELKVIVEEQNILFADVMIENEMAITGESKENIYKTDVTII